MWFMFYIVDVLRGVKTNCQQNDAITSLVPGHIITKEKSGEEWAKGTSDASVEGENALANTFSEPECSTNVFYHDNFLYDNQFA